MRTLLRVHLHGLNLHKPKTSCPPWRSSELASHRAVGLGAEQVERFQGSYVYRALYPRISPYAHPALDAVASTGTFNALVDHLRPVQPCVAA